MLVEVSLVTTLHRPQAVATSCTTVCQRAFGCTSKFTRASGLSNRNACHHCTMCKPCMAACAVLFQLCVTDAHQVRQRAALHYQGALSARLSVTFHFKPYNDAVFNCTDCCFAFVVSAVISSLSLILQEIWSDPGGRGGGLP